MLRLILAAVLPVVAAACGSELPEGAYYLIDGQYHREGCARVTEWRRSAAGRRDGTEIITRQGIQEHAWMCDEKLQEEARKCAEMLVEWERETRPVVETEPGDALERAIEKRLRKWQVKTPYTPCDLCRP